MKRDLQNIPKDELILRVIACCNEIERTRGEYNAAVDRIEKLEEDVERWRNNYNTAMKMLAEYQDKE